MRLEGKIAVITGVGSGMGRAMAVRFSAEGAKIVGLEWNEGTLTETADMVRAAGGEFLGLQGNVAAQADVERLVESAAGKYGRIDVLCNNAGVMDLNQGVAELDDAVWERVMSINVNGPMYATRLVVPKMVAQGGGSIVNTASVAGLHGGAAGVAYTVSKHALIGLTRSTAWMYTTKGVRCNAIAAGAVETNIMQSVDMSHMDAQGSVRTGAYTGIIPGMLKAEDIASLALFLASEEAGKINGAVIAADAGWTAA
jgi:NAD(P)-dependent dehydrogenase (short-subunit alcohol dehydrogenase family)